VGKNHQKQIFTTTDGGLRVASTVGEREHEVEKDRVKSKRKIRLEGTQEGFENRTG